MRMLRRGEATAPPKKITGAEPQPPKAKAEKSLKESRRAHLPVSLWETACAPAEGFQDAKASQSTRCRRGAGGSAPSHAIWRARGLTRSKQSFPEKSPAGAFFPFHRPREAACLCHCVRLDGCEYSHPEPSAFGLSLSHPRRGSTPEAAGGSFTPSGVSRPIPGPGRGKVGAQAPRLLPRWATIGGVGGPAIA